MKQITVRYNYKKAVLGDADDKGKKKVVEEGIWCETTWPVPETDDEAKDRYNVSLAELVELGVRGLSTRLATSKYTADGSEPCATPEEFANKCQALADEFSAKERGPRAPKTSAGLKFASKLLAECGGDMAEFQRRLTAELAKITK